MPGGLFRHHTFGKGGRVSGHAIAVCCNTRCGCKPIYPASYPCTTNSKAVEISRKLRGTRSLDGYRDADILHSSSRRAGPCESASLHSCTGGSAPRPALSAVDILCNKMAPNDLYGNLAGIPWTLSRGPRRAACMPARAPMERCMP